jgi:hypothetical protein
MKKEQSFIKKGKPPFHCKIVFDMPVNTNRLTIEFEKRVESVPVSVFGISCF